MLLNQKITLAMTVWVSLCLTMVGPQNLELFGILILIGILISRELSSVYVDNYTANRMDIFIYLGIIFFVAVVSRRILNILGFF